MDEVYWLRSCQRIAEKISASCDKAKEFHVLKHHVVFVHVNCLRKGPSLYCAENANEKCDWSSAMHWAQWWTRPTHLKIL